MWYLLLLVELASHGYAPNVNEVTCLKRKRFRICVWVYLDGSKHGSVDALLATKRMLPLRGAYAHLSMLHAATGNNH